ncbi:hypothetical protein ACFFQW_08935 [Umezawaea endophytica]|uniref:Uncharacterized protein n=1 Tax=Umezawaea endophytica TaxID=1654476 RepID=A0A9X2VGH0_9PSEU|nr:hypothetical protein [Umezawaea endophytica]MCS7476111.1 hypothetical protein [Umezawaea endophytica]
MSRKTPIRKPIPVKSHRGALPPLTPAQRAVVDAARQLPQFTDPLDVEVALSAAVAPAVDEDVWPGVVANAVAVPSRRSLALLRAVAVLVPESGAGVEADKLVGQAEPGWLGALDGLRVGECWVVDQVAEEGHLTLLCTYSYGDEVHAGLYLVDENLGGVVKNAFITKDVETARTMLGDHGTVEEIAADEAHRRLAEAYGKVDGGPGLGIDPDVYVVKLLVARRIAVAQRS